MPQDPAELPIPRMFPRTEGQAKLLAAPTPISELVTPSLSSGSSMASWPAGLTCTDRVFGSRHSEAIKGNQ
jgi:hypothetical protein